MLKQLYVVYDKVADTIIGGIVQENNDAPAMRAFSDALGTPDSILAKHPEDYALLHIGEIRPSGEIIPCDPQTIITGKLWKEMNNA